MRSRPTLTSCPFFRDSVLITWGQFPEQTQGKVADLLTLILVVSRLPEELA